jgi:TetR/AcrR family transcriptional regulator
VSSKRDQVLDAATVCFGRYGYRRSSMESIAQAAGMSRPAVYQHFGGKDEIFRVVASRLFDDALAQAEAAAAPTAGSQNPADRLYGVLAAKHQLLVGATQEEFRAELIAEAETLTADLLETFQQRLTTILRRLFDDVRDELDLLGTQLSTGDAARLVLASASGIECDPSPRVVRKRLRQLAELTVRGLRSG